MRKVRLGLLVALVASLTVAGSAWAGIPESSNETNLAALDIYRTGTPDCDLVLRPFGEAAPLILEDLTRPGGPRADGYCWLPVEEYERDVVDDVIGIRQQLMGEDSPIAVQANNITPLNDATTADADAARDETVPRAGDDVLGGHRCVVYSGPFFDVQTLGFAAVRAGQVGMVLSGHWDDERMPVNGWVYSPTGWYPLLNNRIGTIARVGGYYSDSSYMRPYYGGHRIRLGVWHYGSHMAVFCSEDPEVWDYVFKAGQKTGTTGGYVVCWVRVWAPWHGRWLDEQWIVYGHAEHTDSGAPVYSVEVIQYPIPNGWPPDPEFAILKGVMWAGSEVSYIFSAISQVTDDLDVLPLPGPFG